MFLLSMLKIMYGVLCVFIVLCVLYQRGKGSMGLGNMGGGNQVLFGSSGGQDIFQKTTWVCCVLLLSGSFALSIITAKNGRASLSSYSQSAPQRSLPTEQLPFDGDN